MIMNLGKRIICIKEIPSNLIDEAIFILKPNAVEKKNNALEEKTKQIIMNEAQDITNEYVNTIQHEKNIEEQNENCKKRELQKEVLYVLGLFIILGVCILSVI